MATGGPQRKRTRAITKNTHARIGGHNEKRGVRKSEYLRRHRRLPTLCPSGRDVMLLAMSRLITTQDVAERASLAHKTILNRIRRGLPPRPICRIGNQWRFAVEDVERWLAEGDPVPAAAEAAPPAEEAART